MRSKSRLFVIFFFAAGVYTVGALRAVRGNARARTRISALSNAFTKSGNSTS